MSRANPQATIVSEEQLVPRANRLVIKKNNQRIPSPNTKTPYIKPPTENQILGFIKTLGYDEDPKEKNDFSLNICCYKTSINVPNTFKKDDVPRKTRSLTVAEKTVAGELAKSISIQEKHTQQRRRSQLTIDRKLDKDVAYTYIEWGQKLKVPIVEDPVVQSLLDLRKGSKASKLEILRQKKQAVAEEGSNAAHNKHYNTSNTENCATHYSSCSNTSEESAKETNDAGDSDMDLSDDNPKGDDDTTSPKNTMHNPEGNPEVRSFLPGASEVSFGAHVDVQATNLVLQEMFPDDAAHHMSSPPATTTHKLPINPQPNSLQAKAKKIMQKAKKNMRRSTLRRQSLKNSENMIRSWKLLQILMFLKHLKKLSKQKFR
ncbi:hypothetical protein Tco_1176566 [Tanacetum coccineum]